MSLELRSKLGTAKLILRPRRIICRATDEEPRLARRRLAARPELQQLVTIGFPIRAHLVADEVNQIFATTVPVTIIVIGVVDFAGQ